MKNKEIVYIVMNRNLPIVGFHSLADAEELCADLMFDACYEEFCCALTTGLYRWRYGDTDNMRLMLALPDARHAGYSYRIMAVPVN